ncbi:hypothetical protein RF11_08314 [Thelohanellus kitauei]|uniref:Uncharacterized protein n=1 Tax=Thelohanellus kitauei TaxID=669202 RepID=A0A0C2M126_THEKT|nr:hypothetical protein RF11_08314 [Thelohanellus kitauei]
MDVESVIARDARNIAKKRESLRREAYTKPRDSYYQTRDEWKIDTALIADLTLITLQFVSKNRRHPHENPIQGRIKNINQEEITTILEEQSSLSSIELNVETNRTSLPALVDTGSHYSYVSQEWAKEERITIRKGPSYEIICANSTRV